MCGIVGYVGNHDARDFLIAGLRRLEYRGYDSAGIAVGGPGGFHLTRSVGRIDSLVEALGEDPADGKIGIGHTRWATHGPATQPNAHPHRGGQNGEVVLVHNGVIENFAELRDRLRNQGYVFTSDTDSEVAAHLIAQALAKSDLPTDHQDNGQPDAKTDDQINAIYASAVAAAVAQLRGTYGLVVTFPARPNLIVAARFGSPLVIGVGEGEYFVASDASPLAGRTKQIVYLADHQIATITADSFTVTHRDTGRVRVEVKPLEIEDNEVSLGGYDHYMLKEIHEQPESVRNAMRGRLDTDDATRSVRGFKFDAGRPAFGPPDHPDRLRHVVAQRPGR